jgi:hypothetical protein
MTDVLALDPNAVADPVERARLVFTQWHTGSITDAQAADCADRLLAQLAQFGLAVVLAPADATAEDGAPRDYHGGLYYRTQTNLMLYLGSATVTAQSRDAAFDKLVEQFWDERLTAAGCVPFVNWTPPTTPEEAANDS